MEKSYDLGQDKRWGYATVLGSIAIHLMIGNLYLWGNITEYVTSYFHYKGDANATPENAVIIIPLSFTVQSFFNPLSAYLQKRYNPRIILTAGAVVCLGGLACAASVNSWRWFVFFQACVFPAGVGILYWTPIMCGWEWFPKRRGAVSGLIVGGFGFGAFIYGFVTTGIVNPDNVQKVVERDGKKIYYP